MEDVGIFYGRLLHLTPIWYFCGHVHLVHFSRFGMLYQEKSGNPAYNPGCQMVSFQTKNPNLGKYWRALDWKMLIYFMAIWNILQTFGIFYDQLVHFGFIWYIFPVLVSCPKKNLATLLTIRDQLDRSTSRTFFSGCVRLVRVQFISGKRHMYKQDRA
jgi:hypothetical protein